MFTLMIVSVFWDVIPCSLADGCLSILEENVAPNFMVQCNLKLLSLDCWCSLPNYTVYTVLCPRRQYSRSSLPLKPRSLHITNMNYLSGRAVCNKTYALNHLSVCKYMQVYTTGWNAKRWGLQKCQNLNLWPFHS
jgi:hypothetical protein